MAISIPPDAAGKVPPQNQEAETSVLGAILLSEQALDGLMIEVKLRAEDFYRERHRLIFRAMLRLKEKSDPEPIDALTVSEELAREGELFRIAQEDRTGELRSIEAVLHDELDKLELISREGMAMTGTPTGFNDIDELTGGFQPGNLIVLAARPSMGKSALMINMAENAAVDFNKPCALFSLEMSETELAQRFIASQAKLNGDD